MIEKKKMEWKFQRLGGIDQALLQTSEELCGLRELDPKLWVALACPAHGLELDDRLLEMIDSDKDGRIRVPEVLAATEWVCAKLKNPASIIEASEVLPIADIDESSGEGRRLAATAGAVLKSLGKGGVLEVGVGDIFLAASELAGREYNGDGILPPAPHLDEDVRSFIRAALETVGGLRDGGGEAGIDITLAEAFEKALAGWVAWKDSLARAEAPLGPDTPEAWELMRELAPKFEDYFLRCDLASYAPQSAEILNPGQDMFVQEGNAVFLSEGLKDLPLSRVSPACVLDAAEGLNPAWRDQVQRFLALCREYLDAPNHLNRKNWNGIQEAFKPYAAAFAAKPEPVLPEVEFGPTASFDSLDEGLIKSVLEGDVLEKFKALAEKDAAYPAPAADMADLGRLVVYRSGLHRLLRNFVSFQDFYTLRNNAAFQAGTLYIDGRSCRLCVSVENPDEHSVLAGYSELFLLYLKCSRKAPEGSGEPEGERLIAAAVTAGSQDLLVQGRNGVFVDNRGYDWDAQVIKVLSKPISLWEAVWEPYKKIARMIGEQISKFAASRQQGVLDSAGKQISSAESAVAAPSAAEASAPPKFDIARSAGLFAAVGLALGVMGTALASLAKAAFSLEWWQFPLVFLGIFLLISGPSVIIAWFKLRKRTLGPLLEASGWAVNSRAPINIPLASALTFTAKLPRHAHRSFSDPLKQKKRWGLWAFIAALAVSAVIGWWWFAKSDENASTPVNATNGSIQEPAAPAAAGPSGVEPAGAEPK